MDKKGLRRKQSEFIEEYLKSENATDAYMKVYGVKNRNTAGVCAHDILRKPKMQAIIAKEEAKKELEKYRVVKENKKRITRGLQGTIDLADQLQYLMNKRLHNKELMEKARSSDMKHYSGVIKDLSFVYEQIANAELSLEGLQAIEAELKEKIASGEWGEKEKDYSQMTIEESGISSSELEQFNLILQELEAEDPDEKEES